MNNDKGRDNDGNDPANDPRVSGDPRAGGTQGGDLGDAREALQSEFETDGDQE